MSLDRSLKSGGALASHRNVLSRTERIAKLQAAGKFNDDDDPLGLPKVGNRKVSAGGKVKKKKAEGEEGEEEAATPTES